MVGAVTYEENNWQMYQWMIENEDEEYELLKTFSKFLKSFPVQSSITETVLTSLIWKHAIRSTGFRLLLKACLLWIFIDS